ncbi:MAG: hypothetical protein H0W05_00365, partial [Thermoleophilaceae bacterium]|nr:hypothetical protein [Thermoleophilaceae bacterium]
RPTERLAAALARRVGIEKPSANWRLVEDQAFDNQIATLELEERSVMLRLEHTKAGQTELFRTFERQLA